MAKSQLYGKVLTAIEHYAGLYDQLLAEAQKGPPLPAATLTALNSQATVVRAAFADSDKHFKDLERRMGPDKSVGDRLRNLKNVFKSSTQLAAARKQVAADLAQAESTFDTIERCVTMVISYNHG